VLWIWDNVEPIAGFPAGTPSPWSAEEQKELADFLRAARGTKAKFLLTSRRDERDWLHNLPARIALPPMPFDESIEMTEELAKKHGGAPGGYGGLAAAHPLHTRQSIDLDRAGGAGAA
jgi:hypothetical protein